MIASPLCKKCEFRQECGGLPFPDGQVEIFSCFEIYSNRRGLFTHIDFPEELARRLGEVNFHAPIHPASFLPIEKEQFPEYVTLVQGGVHFLRPLQLDFVALNLIEILHGDKKSGLDFGERAITRSSILRDWGIAPDTKLLLSGVAGDPALERLWSNYRAKDIAKKIAALNVVGVTAPNFTFWRNAPRIENLINRRRMFRIAEAFSAEGIVVVPHVNSTNLHDWSWMRDFYRAHPELNSICMEFRTGNRAHEVRNRKIRQLASLRDQIGRDLHPIIIGNIEAAREVKKLFGKITAVDSTPAIKTVKRQRGFLNSRCRVKWQPESMESMACMAARFESNQQKHATAVKRRLLMTDEELRPFEAEQKVQMLVPKPTHHIQSELQLFAA